MNRLRVLKNGKPQSEGVLLEIAEVIERALDPDYVDGSLAYHQEDAGVPPTHWTS